MAQTLEQKRAQHAWQKAGEGVAKFNEAYVNDAKGLSALIMNSGLMQVMAFLEGKDGRHAFLGGHLRDWLHAQCGTPIDFTEFMEHLQQAKPQDYRSVHAEAMAWLRWLRQMAPAVEKGGA
ncbi:type III-B CRISPR module-associated protein Cmr5 [Thiohalobacter sp. IOR34]|uniref:type III-B CRISPR module-associated protein Cmr5 n=1 Tax=Thiohalobacter sp. IOR34 TaxID=3057176 RepID=UPI0025AFF217|nr:type III-B CRISPR module-associated protein Cmr5 [Thiohalobacter sp. IOR34]WJW76671.1 type III-B CRISPR module-associated protein Cmr5 [Thiohalobacter sp. IOR34]